MKASIEERNAKSREAGLNKAGFSQLISDVFVFALAIISDTVTSFRFFSFDDPQELMVVALFCLLSRIGSMKKNDISFLRLSYIFI